MSGLFLPERGGYQSIGGFGGKGSGCVSTVRKDSKYWLQVRKRLAAGEKIASVSGGDQSIKFLQVCVGKAGGHKSIKKFLSMCGKGGCLLQRF